MESLLALRSELLNSGYAPNSAEFHIDALMVHACMCRTRADTPTAGAFRELVTYTCELTRKDGCVGNLADDIDPTVREAACDALFDLIMEGV